MIHSAYDYLDKGWPVIPIISKSKKPLVKWKCYQTRMPTRIEWSNWTRMSYNLNLALICGKLSQIHGLDCDGQGAIDWLSSQGPLPESPCVRTPRGLRWLIRRPDGSLLRPWTRMEKNWSFTYLGDNSLAILPPSIHPSGEIYKWDNKKNEENSLGDWKSSQRFVSDFSTKKSADFFQEPANQPVQKNTSPVSYGKESIVPTGAISKGNRNDYLFRSVCKLIYQGLPPSAVTHELARLNHNCNPPVDDFELASIARSVSRYHY